MNLVYFVRIVVASFCVLLLFSCHKNSGQDAESPKISIVEPLLNDTLHLSSGDELHIEFTLTDNAGLHSLQVKLSDENGSEYLNAVPDVMNLKVYPFHTHLTPSITSTKRMTLKVMAEDHAMNALSEEIQFVVLP